ncbi:MAG: NYN domain-containing protein [Sphingomonadaceae bacterium]
MPTGRLVRIGVFYDGSYFQQITNHYRYAHDVGRRIDLGGLHAFLRWCVSRIERSEVKLCQIVEAHYFRGRFTLSDLDDKAERDDNPAFVEDFLRGERMFDQVLAQNNVQAHYLRVDTRQDPPREKGVDVALSLEALDTAIHRSLDWVVLISPDADYVPLLRKLAAIGARTLLLAWEAPGKTVVSRALLAEATETVPLHRLVEEGLGEYDIDGIFLPE